MSEMSLTELIEQELAAGNLELPVFSATALKLQKQLEDPECDIEKIATLIRQDPALTARTLTMSNSAFYGGLTKVDTISRAIVRLGTEKVLSLAMAAAGAMAMQSSSRLLEPFLQNLWQRSFASAHACRWVAETTAGKSGAEAAFLAGLLHDLGELFLLKVMEQLLERKKITQDLTAELVQEVLDALHARMGYELMQAWRMPEIYAEIAAQHVIAKDEISNNLLAMVRLSDLAMKKAGIGQVAHDDMVLAATVEAQALGLNEIQLAQFEVLLDDAAAGAFTMADF